MAHSADTPISDPREDLLGRVGFARALAADVRRAPRGSGFVIGLNGSWGSGKTSILQLVENELGTADAAVVHFNPWLFAGAEQLVEHFFAELSGQLEASGSERLTAVAATLRGYARVVSPLRYLPWIGELARSSAEVAGDFGDALAGSAKEASAQVQATALKEKLAELEHPIVVMVDDLDRLRDQEIVDVVRLIRLVGDFPNLVYLMAFDLATVETALGETREQGRAYLEKVVHISHALPPIRHEDLTAILQRSLSTAIPDPDLHHIDRARMIEVFWTDVRPLFRTVRDVRRYCNALTVTLELIGDEVDLNDVLCLETLRLFEPEFFEGIVSNQYALTGSREPLGRIGLPLLFDEGDPSARDQVIAICEQSGHRRKLLEPILRQLFPIAGGYLGADNPRHRAGEGAGKRRVADLTILQVYLHRRLPPGVLPSRQVGDVIAGMTSEEYLGKTFTELSDLQMSSLLARLADHDGEFPPGSAVPTINAILRRRPPGLTDSFSDLSGSLLIHRLLDRLSPSQSSAALREIDYPNLSCRYELLRMVKSRRKIGLTPVRATDLRTVEQEIAGRVLGSSAADLADEPDLRTLLGLTDKHMPGDLRIRLRSWLDHDIFILRLVVAYGVTTISSGVDPAGDIKAVQLEWTALEALVDPHELGLRMGRVGNSWVDQNFDENARLLWAQARRYAQDPEQAGADLQSWHAAASPDATRPAEGDPDI